MLKLIRFCSLSLRYWKIKRAIKKFGWILQYAPKDLRHKKSLVLTAVKNCGQALQYASMTCRRDHEIVLAAIKTDLSAFSYADPKLKKDPQFCLKAFEQDPNIWPYLDESVKEDLFLYFKLKKAVSLKKPAPTRKPLPEIPKDLIKFIITPLLFSAKLDSSEALLTTLINGSQPYSPKSDQRLSNRTKLLSLKRSKPPSS